MQYIYEISNNMNSFSNKDLIISYEQEIYHITFTQLQNPNEYNDETTIYLDDCKAILKNIYNIEEDAEIIIYKMDYFLDEFLIPITEYKIFVPSINQELSLSYCQNKVINVIIHVAFEDELYKLNSYSKYYSYSCYPDETLTDCKNEDILNERINEFNNNKMSLCEKNCIFMGYDTEK